VEGLVWLSSFPRSGNTFLRTVLANCFALKSASLYVRDLGNDPQVERMAGHIEQIDGRIDFGPQTLHLVKTHGAPLNDAPAIYIVRDGRDATVSLYHFLKGQVPLEDIAAGKSRFGSWSAHLGAWAPAGRAQTLFLRYEELAADLQSSIDRIGDFLERDPVSRSLPSRDELARTGAKWVRPVDAPRIRLQGEALRRYWETNGDAMAAYGYSQNNRAVAGRSA
jgi:hypothetical protein